MPDNIDVLNQRLHKRGTDNEQDIQKRLYAARDEITKCLENQNSLIGYIIVNKDLDLAQDTIMKLVENLNQKELLSISVAQ